MAIAASAAIALALVVASGCGAAPTERSEPPSSAVADTTPPDTAAPATTATAPPSADELEVRALMDRFWPAYQQAIFAPSLDNPELAAMLHAGPSVTIIGRIETMARNGERAEMAEPSVFDRRILSVTFDRPDVAIVRECVIDDLRIVKDLRVDEQDQLLVIDDDVLTVEYTTAVARHDDVWRITVRDASEYLEGVRDCTLFT